MATRFYLTETGTSTVYTPDAGWEIASGYTKKLLVFKPQTSSPLSTGGLQDNETVPITTTQDILSMQLISGPLHAQVISGTISAVISCFADVTTVNATFCLVARIVSSDGLVSRGTLFSVFSTGTAYGTTLSTRIVNAQTLTPQRALDGDRLVIELGSHTAAPTTTGTVTMWGPFTAAADYALTAGLTTQINPWIEFSQDIYAPMPNNHQSFKVGDGMSTGERIR